MISDSPIISEFIEGFEKKFGAVLREPPQLEQSVDKDDLIYTHYFAICPGDKKYSDWDLEFACSPEAVRLETLIAMRHYVRAFPHFELVCDFVGNEWFQMFAFIPEHTHAPFFDLHVENTLRAVVQEYYRHGLDFTQAEHESVDWLMLIYLRKVRNNDPEAETTYLNGWLKYYLSEADHSELCKQPEEFIRARLEKSGFAMALDFLR